MRGVDARRTFLQYDSIFIEIALLEVTRHISADLRALGEQVGEKYRVR